MTYAWQMKKYENSSQSRRSQSNVTKTFNHFYCSPRDIFLPSYIDFRPVVFEISCRQTHRQTDTQTPPKTILFATCAQVMTTASYSCDISNTVF